MKKTRALLACAGLQLIIAAALTFAPLSTVSAACSGGGAKGQVLSGVGETGGDCNGSDFTNVISAIVTIISYVAGVLGVIMVMVAGIKYVTSGGDSNRVGSAKSTLIYAIVGLAIAALAQIIVHFVINTASPPPPPPPS